MIKDQGDDDENYEDNRNISTTAKLRKAGKEVITKRHPQHKVKTQGKEDAQVQGHRFDINEEAAELIGGRRRYGKEERPAQVQGHRIDTNEEPAELSGCRRRYDKTDFLQIEIEGFMRFTQQDRKNLQVVFTKLDQVDQVDQVEGGDPDDKGKGEEETSSKNNNTKEEEETYSENKDTTGEGSMYEAKGAGHSGNFEGEGAGLDSTMEAGTAGGARSSDTGEEGTVIVVENLVAVRHPHHSQSSS